MCDCRVRSRDGKFWVFVVFLDLPVLLDTMHLGQKGKDMLEVAFRKIHLAKHIKSFCVFILKEMEAICF